MVEMWSDVVCPWCYIGKTNLDRALRTFDRDEDVEVVFRSFVLDPEAPARPRPAVDYLAERYGGGRGQALGMMRQVTAVAAGVGLECRLEDSLAGQTHDAHRVLHLAADHGLQPEVAQRLFSAHFTENRSVFDAESLAALAAEVGLPGTDVENVLNGDRYAEAVAADIAQARAYGISAVPFFVIDGSLGVSGAQPPDVLGRVLERAAGGA
jgi:predicted DsbA family dithiol-disulfide isomerase